MPGARRIWGSFSQLAAKAHFSEKVTGAGGLRGVLEGENVGRQALFCKGWDMENPTSGWRSSRGFKVDFWFPWFPLGAFRNILRGSINAIVVLQGVYAWFCAVRVTLSHFCKMKF